MALRTAATCSPLLQLPQGLIQVAAFRVDWVRTWGSGTAADAPFKADAVTQSGIGTHKPDGRTYLFALRVYWHESRALEPKRSMGPDVENTAKTITDAFSGVLYADDDLRFVCAVQSECFGIPDNQAEHTRVWIFAVPAVGPGAAITD